MFLKKYWLKKKIGDKLKKKFCIYFNYGQTHLWCMKVLFKVNKKRLVSTYNGKLQTFEKGRY